MPYAFFNEYFPEIAKNETRTIIVLKGSDSPLPPGEYGFLEMFCNERGCDCRRVMFYVLHYPGNELKAVIAYGWETPEYYAKWMRDDDPKIIKELQGPVLNLASPQSKIAPAILDMAINTILKDKAYIERIKTHYKIYRSKIESVSNTRRSRGEIKLKR